MNQSYNKIVQFFSFLALTLLTQATNPIQSYQLLFSDQVLPLLLELPILLARTWFKRKRKMDLVFCCPFYEFGFPTWLFSTCLPKWSHLILMTVSDSLKFFWAREVTPAYLTKLVITHRGPFLYDINLVSPPMLSDLCNMSFTIILHFLLDVLSYCIKNIYIYIINSCPFTKL